MKTLTETQIREACRPDSSERGQIRSAQPELSLDEIIAEVETCSQLPMGESQTLPPQAYTSETYFNWEVDHVFKNDWFCLAHISQIPTIGDFLNVEAFGEPLIIIHDKDNEIQVLSRVCPHRAMDIMPPGLGYDGHTLATPSDEHPACGNTRFLLCPYHFWTFELDGALKACAEMGQAEGFKREDWSLKSFCTEVWNGFIFVNLDGQAPRSVAEQYAVLNEELEPWDLANMKLVAANEWDCNFNWKVLAENFMESYHHAGAHSKTLQTMMPARDTWTEGEKPFHIRCHLPMKQSLRDEIHQLESEGKDWESFPAIPGLSDEQRMEWGLVMGFPLFTFVTTADSFIWYRILPMGPDRLKLLTTILVPSTSTQLPDFEKRRAESNQAGIDFHLEDMEVCMAVQRGLYTSGYQRGRLSHLEMPVWLIQRFLAARARDTWPTFDRPAAPGQQTS
ncbi:MAG: aromatic ring-hydroxylating dioxygenase subunit alpha [Verrucomicrobiales bacterium]|nr:aromatic ring-hydroxylating dioxygenase subunit alpha [Verrucomicrobiales bacterium]